MNPADIERIGLLAQRAGIVQVELRDGASRLSMRITSRLRGPIRRRRPATRADARIVRAPAIGVFHARHPGTGRAIAEPGQAVKAGQVVAVLQAGPCLRAVTAPADGTLGPPRCNDGTLVGYGTVLYELG